MTELLVARTNGVIRGTDGVLHRVHKGVTLASPSHPVALAAPQAFMPMTVDLPAPQAEATAPGGETLAGAVEDRDHYLGQLTAVAELLRDRGLLDGVDTEAEGWLVKRLSDLLPSALPATVEAEPVRAPAKPRKTAAKPATAAPGGE